MTSKSGESKTLRYDPNVDAKDLIAGDLYHKITTGTKETQWFSLWDCLNRYSLVVLAHYWNVLTNPIAYFRYTLEYNIVWYGFIPGALLSMFYLVMPFALMCVTLLKRLKGLFDTTDWMMDGPGRVFFLKPANPIGALIWDFYLLQSLYVGQYFLVGTNKDAIQHTWYDTILNKDFWSKTLEDCGARIPLRLGRWKDGRMELEHDLGCKDVVIKLPDSYLGIGDSFWTHGEDYKTAEDLRARLSKEYEGKEALILEKVKPKKDFFKSHQDISDVHSLDIITIRTPDDDVKVLSVLLWADCTTSSSHSTQAGYTVDITTETVQDAAGWYSTYFASMKVPLKGMKLKGVREACAAAVQGHKNIEHKWLTTVGWDCMMMEEQIVFFEGNFAGARTPRRIFLSLTNMVHMIRYFYWPFGKSSTPHF